MTCPDFGASPVHGAHQRFQEETGEPEGAPSRLHFAYYNFCRVASDAARHPGHAGRPRIEKFPMSRHFHYYDKSWEDEILGVPDLPLGGQVPPGRDLHLCRLHRLPVSQLRHLHGGIA